MKCIVLAAGYATRLYPITLNTPKPLLEVAGRTILDRIVDKIEIVPYIDQIIVISNDLFYQNFVKWKSSYKGSKEITIINDLTRSNETRLGAIKDICFAIHHLQIQDNVIVLAGDNLFDFELLDFVNYYNFIQTDCITSHLMEDVERIKRTGVAQIDSNNLLLSFEEKPKYPKSMYAVPPFYIYQKETLPLLDQFLQEGNNGDAPGMLLSWLLTKRPIHVFLFQGERF
ncbi:MAG: nucleotidyltransferase family protein, partial [Candidatus Izemoplasmatales bacterium]|nr:nucleotidyltransferase family protein [Candidatus Izemoplasmatales bacterium]